MHRTPCALALALALAPAGAAQYGTTEATGGGPGAGPAPEGQAPPAAAGPLGAPYLDLRLQTQGSLRDAPRLDRETYDQLQGSWRERVQLLLEDPEVQQVVRRAATAWGGVEPVQVVISSKERSAFFRRPVIVLGTRYLGRDADMEAVRRQEKNTILHELGHCLMYRLYGRWLPRVSYRSTEFVGTDSNSHQFDKVTVESSAWCEGFAEGLAAYLGDDERIEEFRFRRTVYGAVRGFRPVHELRRIEGWAAFLVHDFWLPAGDTERLDRSLGVLALQNTRRAELEQHEEVDAYIREHLVLHPEDALRWELVVQLNSLFQLSIARHSDPQAETLASGLRTLSRGHDPARVARAAWEHLAAGDPVDDAATVLSSVRRRLSRLGDGPVFEAPGAARDELSQLDVEELRRRLRRAEQAYDGLMQTIGYSFHPRVKQAAEARDAIAAELARRGG